MLEIDKILTLSTAHVTKETAQQLDTYVKGVDQGGGPGIEQNFDGLSVYPKAQWGWFIYIGDATDDHVKFEELPEELRRVIEFAKGHDCQWLVLDCDGDLADDIHLQTFEW